MKGSPPLRFLAVVLGGWAALRTALIAPPWSAPPADVAVAAAVARTPARPALRSATETQPPQRPDQAVALGRTSPAMIQPLSRPISRASKTGTLHYILAPGVEVPGASVATAAPAARPPHVAPSPRLAPAPARRWSLSAWTFVRRGDETPLAAGGLIGGSQAGGRLTYRLNRDPAQPLALSLRLSTPLPRTAGAEAALGLDWKPIGTLPLRLLAERRQALGGEGRSAFGLTVHGGVSDAPLGRFRLDAYAQAGIVGIESRDLFGDGSIRLSLPLGERVRAGAGAWAAAQPGLARLDVGPLASLRLPVAGRAVTLAADWRLRIAGNARPGSGPTLTLGTDF